MHDKNAHFRQQGIMRKIAVFDFDGTLTSKDTLLDFIRYAVGSRRMMTGFLLFAPMIAFMKMRLIDNHKLKQRLFAYFFKDMPYRDFNELGMLYAERAAELLRRDTVTMLQRHLAAGDDVYVVSASIEEWVRPICMQLGVKMVIGTKVETDSIGTLTGRFASHNCYGPEKVNRFLTIEPDRASYHLTAYGDSGGDKQMFALSDIHHLV